MKFVAPEVEVKLFSTEDVLTSSSTTIETLYQADCKAELPMD